MARTSLIADHELVQRIRRVRLILSDRAGRMVTMADTLTVLLDQWDKAQATPPQVRVPGPVDPLTGSVMAYLDRPVQ